MAAAKKTASKKASKPAEVEPEELELDEVAEEDVEEAPAKGKSKQQEVTFGASDLAKHLSETSGKTVSARELRTLIRKMARDGKGRVDREITAGNRTRYNWSGIKDPEVQAIITAFNSGELEADKKAKLEELKANKAAKKAAGEPVGKKAKAKAEKEAAKAKGKGKKAPAPVEVEDDDEDLDLDEE